MTDPTQWLLVAPILLCVGAIAGTLAGLLGVGGGIVIVPVLFWLTTGGLLDVGPEVAIHFAIATSLMTIIPTSISSARAHWRKGNVDMEMFKSWMPYMLTGALLGGLLAARIEAAALAAIFGAISLLVAINLLKPKPITLAHAPPELAWKRASIAAPIGAISAMMGIGGGTLSVPVMSLLSFSMHRAVGTASLFGLVIAIPGIVGYALAGQNIPGLLPYSLGFINMPAALLIAAASFFFAPLGAAIAHRLNARALRIAFAVFLGISSLRLLFSAIS